MEVLHVSVGCDINDVIRQPTIHKTVFYLLL